MLCVLRACIRARARAVAALSLRCRCAAPSLQFHAREVVGLVWEGWCSGDRDDYIHSANAGSLAHDYASTLTAKLVFNRPA